MSDPSMKGIPESFVSRVAAAIRPVDGLSPGGVPIGSLTVTLSGVERPPIRNRGGWYVFPDLPDGTYTLHIQSGLYRDVQQQVNVAGLEPVALDVKLQPACSYPFPGHATLLRGLVQLPAQKPAVGAFVEAEVLQPESAYTASLGEPAGAGDTVLKLGGLSAGSIPPGSVLLLKDSNAGRLEYVRLASVLPADPAKDGYNLTEPVRYPHIAGTPAYAAKPVNTITASADGRGEFVLALGSLSLPKAFVAMSFALDGFQHIHRDIQCEEGRTTSLGVLTLLSI
ncbi:hypothetical protein PCCS19_32850 [Paenibacillus sp. CCS19]|uniref:carboxypeptidase-like regulatory domain-containing protein n=1 Tax=Paenibacillus sp. CCS19 TaxID=3158387 RepID=UPI00256B4082|nr:carboxypeptidase-like regulatory domain-containing protein [Paenibacillus cellulosilyticus]GMK40230.1 hypothetical protein PCCS19_32850 [Paenibacillus cellulosilyticus]